MVPRPLPRGSGTPPDLNFQWNLMDFPRFSYDCGWCLSDFLHAGESFHILLRLSAVNLENCLQGKVLDNTFDILNFVPWNWAEIENFLHSKALRFCLEGSGIFMILYLRRTGTFEIGFLPVGFHEIRRAT